MVVVSMAIEWKHNGDGNDGAVMAGDVGKEIYVDRVRYVLVFVDAVSNLRR